jgi:O-antigen/teichoic acid export membrane protein
MTRYAAESTADTPDRLSGLFHKSLRYMSVFVVPLVVSLIAFAVPIVDLVFGPAFWPTVMILQVLAVSLLFLFMVEPCNRIMLVKDRQKVIVMFLGVSATANVLLNLLLIPDYGAVGSAMARTTSSGLFFTLSIFYIGRNLVTQINTLNLMRPIISGLMMLVVSVVMLPLSLLGSILSGIITYVVFSLALGAIASDDINILRLFVLRKAKNKP